MLSEYKFDILDSLELPSDEDFPNFGNCPRCNNEYNAPAWCDACDQQELVDKFDTWSTGDDNINLLIRESQRSAPDYYNYLEFIPYNRFVDIEQIGEGGFGIVYKATWLDGIRNAKKNENGIWIKNRSDPCTVALKEIKELKNNDQKEKSQNKDQKEKSQNNDQKDKNYRGILDYINEVIFLFIESLEQFDCIQLYSYA